MRCWFILLLCLIGVFPCSAQTRLNTREIERVLHSQGNVLRLLDPQLRQLIELSYTPTRGGGGIISDTMAFPWRYVGYLEFPLSDNVNMTCTGTMLSPHVVLTAAHCLYEEGRGYLTNITFVPGRNAGMAPLGRFKAKKTLLLQPITGKLDLNTDFGFVILEKSPFPDASKERFVPVGVVDERHFEGGGMPLAVVAAGYPTDSSEGVNRGLLTVATSSVYRNTPPEKVSYINTDGRRETMAVGNQFEHRAFTERGTSGGPVFVYHPGYNQFALVGLISNKRDYLDQNTGSVTDSWAVAIKINILTQNAIQRALRQYESKSKPPTTNRTTNR
jgi:V8-like Glu-specific endopeptidase